MASLELRKGILGERLAGHLLRRATYRYDIGRIKEFAQYTASEASGQTDVAGHIYSGPTHRSSHRSTMDQQWYKYDHSTTRPPQPCTILRAQRDEIWWNHSWQDGLFLHKCLVTTYNQSTSERFFDYLALLYKFTTGSFKVLARKMTMDNPYAHLSEQYK